MHSIAKFTAFSQREILESFLSFCVCFCCDFAGLIVLAVDCFEVCLGGDLPLSRAARSQIDSKKINGSVLEELAERLLSITEQRRHNRVMLFLLVNGLRKVQCVLRGNCL